MDEKGVYQQENGLWAYRFSLIINGQRVTKRKSTDEFGNKLKSKAAAIKAKKRAIEIATLEQRTEQKIIRKKVADIYKEYSNSGRTGKAYGTIKKQDSLWNIHLKEAFGTRYIDTISVAEVNDYLENLYYAEDYSYKYVESFLKMFYLIWGQAYSRNYLDIDTYSKMCLNKGTKIRMPELKIDEDLDIVYFSKAEVKKLDKYFNGTNAQTAYMLGRYCGLRINECYGLLWQNVNFAEDKIIIDKQMQYQNELIKLVPVKTRNAKRTIYIPKILKEYLYEKYLQQQKAKEDNPKLFQQNQKLIENINGEIISSTELVNTLPDGKIQTVNSMKYHTQQIKKLHKITFKYHYLRHTYGTFMADLNTPEHLLCMQMGHSKIETTHKYYLAVSDFGVSILKKNLQKI